MTIIEKYAEELSNGSAASTGYNDFLRRFGRELIKECVPEMKHEDKDVRTGWSRLASGWNGCRTAVLDKARELIGE